MIRPVTRADIPFLLALGATKYPDYPHTESEAWLNASIPHSNGIIWLRSETGSAMAELLHRFWETAPSVWRLVFLATADPAHLEGYRLLKTVIKLARAQGATEFQFDSDTGVDFSPFAKRLGAVNRPPAFTVTF